jgi:hypothetical protein
MKPVLSQGGIYIHCRHISFTGLCQHNNLYCLQGLPFRANMAEVSVATIEVTETSPNSFSVTVHGSQVTTHQVSVKPDYARQLLTTPHTITDLIAASFDFLLDRESNSSILRSFDLSVIERYFPEYPQAISRYLK